MSPQGYALWTSIHGHLAVLGLVLLLHPLVSLRRRPGLTPWTLRTAWGAAGLIAVPFGLGWWLYPTYRMEVKPALFEARHPALWSFESKEHLAAFCVALAVSGTLTLQAAGRTPEGRRAAWWLLAASWVCGAIAGGLGVYVAAVAQPGW